MTLTMLEAAKLIENPLALDIVETIVGRNPVLEVMPFQNIAGSAYRYNREETLPGIGFRGINEAFDESTAVLNPQVESLTILGGDSDYDVALVKMQTGTNAPGLRAAHDRLKAKAASLKFLKTFFDGDSDSAPREFDGINKRLGTGAQHKQLASGGATLTLDDLDETIDLVDGTPTAIFCSKAVRRKINALIRAQNSAVEVVNDQFGRQLTAYAGIPIYVIETDNEGNAILGYDEDDGTGSLDTASLYVGRFDLDAIHGIQTEPIQIRDLGEIDSKSVFRTRIEWITGMVLKHPRAVARLSRINNA